MGGGDGGERDGFRPSQGPVNDGEQVDVAARGGQRPDKVHVDVGRNGGEVPVSLLAVGVRVCETCPAGSAGKPWPSE